MENSPHKRVLPIRHQSDRSAACRAVRETAVELGFGPQESEELSLVAAELSSNLLRYAGGGDLIVTGLHVEQKTGLQIESLDSGPGFRDILRAQGDGHTTGGGLGYGLGTVNRFTDEMNVENLTGPLGGARVVCRRWIRDLSDSRGPVTLSFGAATRAKPGSGLNGDDYFIKTWGANALVGVIDGIGHGQYAHRASEKAKHYLQSHFDQPFPNIFIGVGRECLTTRGVVMALARFECETRSLVYACIGNIEARVWGASKPMSFGVRRGIIGLHSIKPMITKHVWEPGCIMVMHSDGLRSHWRWEEIPDLTQMPAQQMAGHLLNNLTKDNDDSTAVVIKDAG